MRSLDILAIILLLINFGILIYMNYSGYKSRKGNKSDSRK